MLVHWGFTSKIRNNYGASKIYDTRIGINPEFDNDLLEDDLLEDHLLKDEILNKIAIVGN